MPDRPPFPIPDNIHAPLQCLQLCIPNDPTWKQVIAGLLDELNQWYNWQRDEARSGKECAQVWRRIYTEIDWSDMSCCCPDTPPVVYRWQDGVYQKSTDGGATWTDAPDYDYRNISTQWSNPNDMGFDVSKCAAADAIVKTFRDDINQTVTEDMGAAAILGVIAAVLLIFLSAGTSYAISAQVVAVVAAILSTGVTAWQAAFTVEVWDDFRCILYQNMQDDLSFTDADIEAIKSAMTGAFIGIVNPTLQGYIQAAGKVGLTNMARSNAGDPDANCSSCAECGQPLVWKYGIGTVTFDHEDSSGCWYFVNVTGVPEGETRAVAYLAGNEAANQCLTIVAVNGTGGIALNLYERQCGGGFVLNPLLPTTSEYFGLYRDDGALFSALVCVSGV